MTPDRLRIALLGNSGSGKSTLARGLAEATGAAVLDLDTVAWEPGKVAVPRPDELARADVARFCDGAESWVIEGCYAGLVESVLERRPTLVLLDPGLEACVANCRARPWEPHKYASREEQDARLPALLEWVADYYVRDGDLSHARHVAVLEAYTGPKVWITERPGGSAG